MIKKVCLFVNYNLYESKRYFTKKLAEAMHRKGIETLIFDVEEKPLDTNALTQLLEFSPQLTCSFNSLLPISDQTYLWDMLQIPHLSLLVDPAFYALNLTKSPYSILSCVDRFDCEALASLQFEHVFFFPHAVEKPQNSLKNTKRPFDIVFFGTCLDYESSQKEWKKKLPKSHISILNDAADLVLSDKRISLAQALVTASNASKQPPVGSEFITLFHYLDHYTRGKDRISLIRSITSGNIHVFGELSNEVFQGTGGWEHYLGNQKNVTIHPSTTFEESLNILTQSKICLNSMPFFKNGTHERIFNGLVQGAYSLTSDSIYLQTQFHLNEGIGYYSPSHWEVANAQIESLLSNESLRKEQVEKGRTKVIQNHTWDNRVELLMKELPPILNKIMM